MKYYIISLFAILLTLVFAVGASANTTKTCYTFDLKPYSSKLSHSKGITEITLYHSGFQTPGAKSTTYFVDYGFKKNNDLHTFVDCQKNSNTNYLKCVNEIEAASLGILLNNNNQATLHLEFIILSEQDEPLRVLQPKNKREIISIKGKTFACPATTPEDEL